MLRTQIRIRWIRKILASWIRIQIQGVKYKLKTAKKNFTPKTHVVTFEKNSVFRIHIIMIRIRDHGSGSGSEVTFDSVNRIFPIRH